MAPTALQHLNAELASTTQSREGVVIAVRNNPGGFFNPYATDVLARRHYLTMATRGLPAVPMRIASGERALDVAVVVADAVLHDCLLEFRRIDLYVLVAAGCDHADRELGHLPDLLFERHASEQIADALDYIATAWGNVRPAGQGPFTATELAQARSERLTPQQVYQLRQKLNLP